jgi:membrane protein DedA with SNARE-associated domain
VLGWLHHLGGLGLILLGVLDNSFVPVPGSLDALTIVLAASDHNLWPYYAAMATVGAVFGGYLTYRLAKKEGKDQLERRVPRDKMKKVERIFRRWGFGAVVIVALLPPPAPMVPFLLAAGAAQYPPKRFLGALALGRGVRYSLLAFLGAMYGNALLSFISKHAEAIIVAVISAALVGVAAFLLLRHRKKRTHKKRA